MRREISLDGLPVELLGLDDAHIRAQDYRVAPRQAPERFGVAVMHSPDSAPEAAALGYAFMVAGHTHGGQVCLPWFGAVVTNCSMPRRIVKGLARMGDAVLHTSPGPRDLQVRPVPVLVPPGGHPPGTHAPGAGRRRIATLTGPRDVAQFGSAQRSGR